MKYLGTLGIPARLAASWLVSGVLLAILSWDLGFAAALMMASSVFAVPGLLIAAVLRHRIAAAPLVWTLSALVVVTVVAFALTGLLALFSFLISVPTAALFLLSFPATRRFRLSRSGTSPIDDGVPSAR